MTTPKESNKQKLHFDSLDLHNVCGCTATVLIVEDNLYNVVPVRMILRQTYDLTLERASNGLEGIEMFKKDLYKTCCDVRYQIVLMDIKMPVMNGIDSAKGITAIQDDFFSNPPLPES
jgi:CheY-like chemotaxis protein